MSERQAAAGASVLVVENEPLIRMVAVDCLEDEGVAVLEAGDADAALALLRERPDVGPRHRTGRIAR